MGAKGEELARQFEEQIAALKSEVEKADAARWQQTCGDEGWTVAATAQHVLAQFGLERRYMAAAAEGAEMPQLTWDDINKLNETRAAEQSACSKDTILKMIRDEVPPVAAYVRGLSDAQLERTAPLPLADGAEVSAQQLIEGGVLIDHVRAHTKSIQAAS
jgi:hypothetical protein